MISGIELDVAAGFAAIVLVHAVRTVARIWRAKEPPPRCQPPPNCCLPEDSYEDHLRHTQETSYTGLIQTDDEFLVNASDPTAAEWRKVERILTEHGGDGRMLLTSNREGIRSWIVEDTFRKTAVPYRPHR